MSRILFLTPQLPYPPHQGAAIRNLHLIKIAAQRHDVAVGAFVRSPAEAAGAEALREWAADVRVCPAPVRRRSERAFQTAFSLEPDMGRRLASPAFTTMMRDTRADVVQSEGIEMVQYASLFQQAASVFDCHNAEWVLQKRTFGTDFRRGRMVGAAYSFLQWWKLRRYERLACQASQAVVAVSDEDRAALLDLDPRLPVDVVPNGVDCAWFQPAIEPPAAASFLFTGTLDFRPNVDAVRWLAADVWPRIRRQLPAATLTLAGREPVPAISRLDGVDGIRVVASPPDIRPYFAASAVYMAPIRAGGGSRYKLLEAMATGLGIVSTTIGAEGLAIQNGLHARLADSAAELAAAAVELAGDRAQRQRLGEAARDLAVGCYDWPVLAQRLWPIYERVLAAPERALPTDAPSP